MRMFFLKGRAIPKAHASTHEAGGDDILSQLHDASGQFNQATNGEISGLTEKTSLAANDLFLIEDSAASNAKKKVKYSTLPWSWTTYTPAWTAATTNPVIGNGTKVGRYLTIGKLCFFTIEIVMGSTTTYGVGAYCFSFPVAWSQNIFFTAPVFAYDNSATKVYTGSYFITLVGTGIVGSQAGTQWSPTVPITWAVNDIITISGFYETA